MSHTVTFIIAGLVIAGVGGLVFFGATKLLDRQNSTVGSLGGCLLALVGAVIIFAGVGIIGAGLLLP